MTILTLNLNYLYLHKQNKFNKSMAKPIKETPILQGRDAVNFSQHMKEAENTKVSAAELSKIK